MTPLPPRPRLVLRAGFAGRRELSAAGEGADAVAAEELLQANPGSAQATRDVVVSHYQMAAFANRHSDHKDTTRHRRAIYELLRPAIERGMTFDPPTVQFYEELKAEFAQ